MSIIMPHTLIETWSIFSTNISLSDFYTCHVGNYTEDSLQRIAKSTEMKKIVAEKLLPHYKET